MRRQALFLALATLSLNCAASQEVAVLSNSIDGSLAGGLYDSLKQDGFSVSPVNASGFESIKNSSKRIIILGGHRSPEGVGAFSASLLAEADRRSLLSGPGTGMLFARPNAWRQGQIVLVAAGYEREDTQAAWTQNYGRIADALRNFNMVHVTSHRDGSLLAIQTNTLGFNVDVSNNGSVPSTGLLLEAYNARFPLNRTRALLNLAPNESGRVFVQVKPLGLASNDSLVLSIGERNLTLHVSVSPERKLPRGICSMCEATA